MSIDISNAATRAIVHFKRLYKIGASRIKIEEAEQSKNGLNWLITLGYDIPNTAAVSPVESALGKTPSQIREYKIFEVSVETGEVRSMKIRKID